jgi:5-methylcytosine-specific restriction endonuclease McrA
VIDYLSAKYRISRPTTMLYHEAKVFGIDYPLPHGWLKVHGDVEITPLMAEQLRRVLRNELANTPKQSKSADLLERALRAIDDAWLVIKSKPEPTDPEFLRSKAWQRLRYQALRDCGARCQACGKTVANGAVLNVDHIKPRRLFPQLALTLSNLQVLCSECNAGKGNWDMTDFRSAAPARE